MKQFELFSKMNEYGEIEFRIEVDGLTYYMCEMFLIDFLKMKTENNKTALIRNTAK